MAISIQASGLSSTDPTANHTFSRPNKKHKRKMDTDKMHTMSKNVVMNEKNLVNQNPNLIPINVPEKKLKLAPLCDLVIIDMLRGSNALHTLKEIQMTIESLKSKSSEIPDDPVDQFLREGGTAQDLLSCLESKDKVKSSEVEIVFNACEAILLHLGSEISPTEICDTELVKSEKHSKTIKMQNLAIDLTRELLQKHIRYFMMFLSETNSVHQAMSSLRLLTAMVAVGGPAAGKEVLLKIDFQHPNLSQLSDRCSSMNDVILRKCHLEFLVSFFVAGNTSVMKDFLDKSSTRNHLASLFPGLIYDECDTVQIVLGTLHQKLLNNLGISKTFKMKLFSVHNLKYILALFGWKGPKHKKKENKDKRHKQNDLKIPDDNDVEVCIDENDGEYQAELECIRQITKDFFISALTSVKRGLVFLDSTCGTSGRNQNLLLQNILQSMTSYKPWKEKHMSLFLSEIVIRSLSVCPDQVRPYFTKALQPLWAPKEDSDTWKLVVIFLRNILKSLNPINILNTITSEASVTSGTVSSKDATSKILSNVIGNIFCNDKIFREVINPAISSSSRTIIIEGYNLFIVLLEKIEYLLSSDDLVETPKENIVHRLIEKVVSQQVLVDAWTNEIALLCSDCNTEDNLQCLKNISRVLNFYWTYHPSYVSGSSQIALRFLNDINTLSEHLAYKNDLGSISHIQLILLKRLASSAKSSATALSTAEFLLSQEHLKVVLNLATLPPTNLDDSLENKELAVETLLSILQNAGLLSRSVKSHQNILIWIHSLQFVNEISVKEKLKQALINCISQSLASKEELIREAQYLEENNVNRKEDICDMHIKDTSGADDEIILQTLLLDSSLVQSLSLTKDQGTDTINQGTNIETLISTRTKLPKTPILQPIEHAILKFKDFEEISLEFFSNSLCALISFQDDPEPLCKYIFDEVNSPVSSTVQSNVQLYIDGLKTTHGSSVNPSTMNADFSLEQSIFRNLLAIKLSNKNGSTEPEQIIEDLNTIESYSRKIRIVKNILEQKSIEDRFNPHQVQGMSRNKMILTFLTDVGTESDKMKYLQKFISALIGYLENADFGEECAPLDVVKLDEVLQESFSVLVSFDIQAEILYHKLQNHLPQVDKVAKKENEYLRCVVSSILGSFTKYEVEHAFDNDQIVTYVTNLMEMILSSNLTDQYSERLMTTLNTIISSRCKVIQAMSSVHISLAVKSTLKSSTETLVHLINKGIKLAKVFRKLVAKESGIIGDVEKLSSAAAASLKTSPEAKSKFINIIKNILQPEVDKFLRSNTNISNQAIKSVQKLVKMLISCYNVEIELKDRAEYEVENIHQLELIDAIFSVSDSDDDTKSWILIPSMKIAVATLKMNEPEDDYEPLFEIISRRVEQLHSLSSFYTNATHCEAWSKFVKSILKNALKLSSSTASERHGTSMKKGILALKMLTKLCKKLHSISNAKKKKTRGWKEKADADCHQIFNLICGHSNFLSLLYSKSKDQDLQNLKYELLNLMVLLINSYPKICDDLELTVFLGAYHGTLSAPDCSILQMLYRCEIETSGHERISKLAILQPLLWGQAAVSKYSTLHTKMSKMTQSSEILQLIEPERMLRSALKFPLNLKMDISNTDVAIDYDSNYYDPRFFLPLICNVCTPGAYVDRHLKLIDSGVLALVFASFSSYDPSMRALGCTALSRVHDQIASAKKALSAEKQIWLHLIDVVKNGLAQQLDEQGVPKRVPSITTVFLARITAILSSPLDPMYRPLSSFILAKPSLEMFTVPEFSRLFHSQNIRQPNEDEEINNGKGENNRVCFSNTQHITERNWILTVIRDGLRDSLDFNILEQNFIFKIVLTFFSGRNKNLQADASKHIILEILNKAVRIKDRALDLIKRHGFLLWLVDQATLLSAEHSADTNNDLEGYGKVCEELAQVFCECWNSSKHIFKKENVVQEELITLTEFQNTATDFIAVTIQMNGSKSVSLRSFRSLVMVNAELRALKRTDADLDQEDESLQADLPSSKIVKEISSSIISHITTNPTIWCEKYGPVSRFQREIENIMLVYNKH